MPDAVDAFGNYGGPEFPDYFVQTDGSHVVKVIKAGDFGNKFHLFIFEPRRDRAVLPQVGHMPVDKELGGVWPGFDHVGGNL